MHTIILPLNRLTDSSRDTILRSGFLHTDTDHAQDTALLICEALDALPHEVLCLAVGGCLNLQRGAVAAALDRLGSDKREDLDEARELRDRAQAVVDGFAEVFPETAIPAQDSGEALVGVECYVRDGYKETERIGWLGPVKISRYCPGQDRPYDVWDHAVSSATWRHARPVALGLPQ